VKEEKSGEEKKRRRKKERKKEKKDEESKCTHLPINPIFIVRGQGRTVPLNKRAFLPSGRAGVECPREELSEQTLALQSVVEQSLHRRKG
jgi:hypothetical protein